MGKIVVKAQQQTVFNKDKSGVKSNAYVLRPVRYTTMRSNDIVNYCAANSVVPKAYLSASMVALAQCIENFLLNGHSVEFPNLGIFSLSSNGVSEADVNKAGIAQLNRLNVRFLPCTQLKTQVENVDLEFDGVYDIAGENEEGVKFYSKVVRKLTAVGSEEDGDPDAGNDPEGDTPTPPTKKTVTLSVSPSGSGTVTGGGQYDEGATATLKATPASGFHFVKWSDHYTSATRTMVVSSDITLQAIFAADTPQGGGDDDGDEGGGSNEGGEI